MNCFGCLYVWMFGPGRVLPHTTEQKTSPNGLQEYVFMEVLGRCCFEVFEAHPSIHTLSIVVVRESRVDAAEDARAKRKPFSEK